MPVYNKYSDEIVEYVCRHSEEYSVAEMAAKVTELFGRPVTYGQMRAFYKNHKCHARPRTGRPGKTKFPDGMGDYIRSIVKGKSIYQIADLVNARYGSGTITPEQVHTWKKNHKVPSGTGGQYGKGHVPFNKGKHCPAKGRAVETQFKKGNRPHNTKPVGSERDLMGYIEVKVAEPNVWKLKHRIVYEQHHGPIPEDGLIIFRDGNTRNFDIDNLTLVTRAENAQLTVYGLRSGDPEITNTGLNTVRLRNAIKEKKKEVAKRGQSD